MERENKPKAFVRKKERKKERKKFRVYRKEKIASSTRKKDRKKERKEKDEAGFNSMGFPAKSHHSDRDHNLTCHSSRKTGSAFRFSLIFSLPTEQTTINDAQHAMSTLAYIYEHIRLKGWIVEY